MYYCAQAVERWHPLCWECIYVCFVYAVMATRAQLLSATVPMPDMSTSPSGIRQTETAKSCHPDSVAEMDIAPEVMEYISRLGVTPKRFKVVDYNLAHVRSASSLQSLLLCLVLQHNTFQPITLTC